MLFIGDMEYDRKTGALTYPQEDPGRESEVNGRQTGARRPNFSRASVRGRTHLLGHSGRRRTLDEINFDLSKEGELITETYLTPPIEEEIATSSQNNCTYTRNCKNSSPAKIHPHATSNGSVLSYLRETLLPRSLKNKIYRTDQNENTDILNSSHQCVIPSEPRLRTASLQLQKGKQNDPLVKKYSTDSFSGSSSFAGYGTLSEGLPSTNTISIELSDNESSSDLRNNFQNNTSFNAITHF